MDLQRTIPTRRGKYAWFGHSAQELALASNMIQEAVKEGRYTLSPSRGVCKRCRYWRIIYTHSGGMDICKQCWEDMGEPDHHGKPARESTSEITAHRTPDIWNGPYEKAIIVAPTGALVVTETPSALRSVFLVRNGVVQLCPGKYVDQFRDHPAKEVREWAQGQGFEMRWVPYVDDTSEPANYEDDLWAQRHNPVLARNQ